jgi:hypothetical protein
MQPICSSAESIDEPEVEAGYKRNARFLVYWMTTTSMSTLTSYTSTLTVGSLSCTPSSFELSLCGTGKK